tara:strand:+ start:93 stop:566 length:474 start_codon:yes stop_codon:yes gene_type:complete
MKERWKDIPGYEGFYQASDLGNIKSLSDRWGREIIKSTNIDRMGYYYTGLSSGKKSKTWRVHQLVAMAFLNHIPCGLKLVVDHIDEIKTNNKSSNLRITTNRDNSSRRKNGSSVYTGVHFCNTKKKWIMSILINSKRVKGTFINEIDAHNAYQKALK